MKTPSTRTEKLHDLCYALHADDLLKQINDHPMRGQHKPMSKAAMSRYKNWGKHTKLDEPPIWAHPIIDSIYTKTYNR